VEANIAVLPGDGIGPEVISAAASVLEAVSRRYNHAFHLEELMFGGNAMDSVGTSLPDETLRYCLQADAILLGAVGGPKWENPAAEDRPERGLLSLRKELGLFANLRPVSPHPALWKSSPLRPELLDGVDLLVVRELTGGIYFGTPRERRQLNGEILALDTMVYSQGEIRRIAHTAFKLSQTRRQKVTSVDKANVLESSRLWRQTVAEVALEYPAVTLEHLLVDAATMHLLTRPASFDVIVTGNLFGDILTDEASVLAGSMGVLPSASLGEDLNQHGRPRGLFEPIHGSAPDIAGQGIANPIGAILSLAMLFRNSLGLVEEATTVEDAVEAAFSAGHLTIDLAQDGKNALSTRDFGEVIAEKIVEAERLKDEG
jgi:3-isopropylmalate dehydrogenase